MEELLADVDVYLNELYDKVENFSDKIVDMK